MAVWITGQIGIDSVLRASRSLGVQTPLERYPTTALGASEMNLLELANAYRTMASGIVAEPYVIRAVVRDSALAEFYLERGRAARPTLRLARWLRRNGRSSTRSKSALKIPR